MSLINKLIKLIIVLPVSGLLACGSKTTKKTEPAKPDSTSTQSVVKKKQDEKQTHVAQMTFVEYLDDGDYSQLLARQGDSTFVFINEKDTVRNMNRGDKVRIAWRNGTITLPGDDDAEVPARLLVSVKKTGDGPVSGFRKTYGKKLKYTWPTDEQYTSTYLDKLYLLTEYYLAKTQNPLLQTAIKNGEEITYSIESREREGRSYKVIGIAPVGHNGGNIVQWLFIDEERNNLAEYDLPEDKLVLFN